MSEAISMTVSQGASAPTEEQSPLEAAREFLKRAPGSIKGRGHPAFIRASELVQALGGVCQSTYRRNLRALYELTGAPAPELNVGPSDPEKAIRDLKEWIEASDPATRSPMQSDLAYAQGFAALHRVELPPPIEGEMKPSERFYRSFCALYERLRAFAAGQPGPRTYKLPASHEEPLLFERADGYPIELDLCALDGDGAPNPALLLVLARRLSEDGQSVELVLLHLEQDLDKALTALKRQPGFGAYRCNLHGRKSLFLDAALRRTKDGYIFKRFEELSPFDQENAARIWAAWREGGCCLYLSANERAEALEEQESAFRDQVAAEAAITRLKDEMKRQVAALAEARGRVALTVRDLSGLATWREDA